MSDALLTHEQTLELLRNAQGGDEEAIKTLVQKNEPLIRSIIRKFTGRGTEYEDLFQIGSMGFMKAIRNYDETYGVRFSTYAVPLVMGEIKRFLRDDGMIKVSRTLKELAARAARAEEKLRREKGQNPSVNEIAAELDVDAEELVFALESSRALISIDDPLFDDPSSENMAERTLPDTGCDCDAADRVMLRELISRLEPRERQIVVLRYFKDKTQMEIAKMIGVSQVQVSRLETQILHKLRQAAL
ncbi:MAG: SigB/SigF/SigG family RNA polymerase sigma factor [Bacillota bacterium]|nr:SigB/SigF/SigG family RNA polymerase sigma factor [Bacillota bacterium]